ncbi:MAG: fimbrillin family protein [Bacteroidales bacterium]|nr:fimbrillin family protein [Bacteroidales bacterium]
MKKKLFLGLLAAAAVTFTACQKDEVINEVPQDQAIGFGTYVGRDAQTKASMMDLGKLQANGVGFGVYAYYTNTSDYDQNSQLNFMWDEHVTYSTTTWGYTNTKYWPSETGKKFTFIAYAPANDNTNITDKLDNNSVHAGDPTFKFTVNSDVANQTDLLYAAIKNYQTKATNDVQNFMFHHALSRIGFSAKPYNENDKISITSISIKGLFTSSGTFNIATGNFSNPINTVEVIYTPTVSNTEITGSTAASITTDGNYIMIIPTENFKETDPNNPSNDKNITVTVNYSIQVKDDKMAGGYSAAIPKRETGTIDHIVFEKGKAYTIVLTISPSDPIKFGVTAVDAWDNDPNENGEQTEEAPVTTSGN